MKRNSPWCHCTAAASSLIAIAVSLVCTPAVQAQDASKYYTVLHPEQFQTDWAGGSRRSVLTSRLRMTTRKAVPLANPRNQSNLAGVQESVPLAMLHSKGSGRQTCEFSEAPTEVTLICESGGEGHLCQRQVGSR